MNHGLFTFLLIFPNVLALVVGGFPGILMSTYARKVLKSAGRDRVVGTWMHKLFPDWK